MPLPKPTGWLGPWISESRLTPDLLQEAGYTYTLDWCCDDQPIWFATRGGRLLAVPYPQEINDIPAIAVRRAGAAEFADMIVDQFDEMRSQSAQQPLVCGIALHTTSSANRFACDICGGRWSTLGSGARMCG